MIFRDRNHNYRLTEAPDLHLHPGRPSGTQADTIALISTLNSIFGVQWAREEQPFVYEVAIDLGTAAGAGANAVTTVGTQGVGTINFDRDSDFIARYALAVSRLRSTGANGEDGSLITNPGDVNLGAAAAGEGHYGCGSIADNPWTVEAVEAHSNRRLMNVAVDGQAFFGSVSTGPRELARPWLIPRASSISFTVTSLIDLANNCGGYIDYAQVGYVIRARLQLIGFKIYDAEALNLTQGF